jgi:hypothetical protein
MQYVYICWYIVLAVVVVVKKYSVYPTRNSERPAFVVVYVAGRL